MVDVVDTMIDPINHLANLNGLRPNEWAFHAGFITSNSTNAKKIEESLKLDPKFQQDAYSKCWGVSRPTNRKATRPAALHEVLKKHNFTSCIDMVDIDIQGAEYALVDREVVALLTHHVLKIHIGTHRYDVDDKRIIKLFVEFGWTVNFHYPKDMGTPYKYKVHRNGKSDKYKVFYHSVTPFGPVHFGDGVISLRNPQATACFGIH